MADNQQSDNKHAAVDAQNQAELQKWEGDFKEEDLAIPYKREAATDEESKDDTADIADESTENNTADDTDIDKEIEKVTEVYTEPEPVVTIQDPGEFDPGDISFEVTLADGKTHTVSSLAEAEALADDPDNFETPRQLTDFNRKVTQMQNKYDKAYDKWETQKQQHDAQVEEEAQRIETIQNYQNEFQYLASKGLLPEIPADLANADWQDPDVASNEIVKQYTAVLDYMLTENEARTKARVPLLSSVIDAFNAMQADPANKKQLEAQIRAEAEKRASDAARKAAGARIAGASPSNVGMYVPKGIAVGNPNVLRRGASVWDD